MRNTMSVEDVPWSSDVYGVLLHPDRRHVLLLPGAQGWALPQVRLHEHVWPRQVAQPCALLETALGLPLNVVRCAGVWTEERPAPRVEVLYLLEARGGGTAQPAVGQWVAGEDVIAALPLARPQHRALIAACMAEAAQGASAPLRPDWQRAGWFGAATAWIEEQVRLVGRTLCAPVEQVRVQGTTCVLHGRATGGDVYFKVAAALPLWADEPALTEGLARLYPEHVVGPLARAPEQRWMLLDDLGAPLGTTPEVAVWTRWLRQFAALQQHSASRVDELLALGCVDRRVPQLAGQIAPFLNDASALAGLEAQERDQLRRWGPWLEEMCAQLTASALPPTLVHGDLHPGNIVPVAQSFRFFDWTDGCVACPLFDLVTVQDAAEAIVGTAAWASLRESYLALWTAYERLDRLRALWVLAEPLGYLHDALSYHQVVQALEPDSRWEVDGMVPFLLGKVVQCLTRLQGR